MTDLYAVRVLAVDPPRRRMHLRVTAINPDVWDSPLPDDETFFLRDLEDDPAILDLLAEEDSDVEDTEFVEEVKRTATRNHPFTEEAEQRLSESGESFPWEDAGPLHEMSPQAAGALIRKEEMRPGADYDVLVTDSRLIGHLTAGDWWRTTAYPGVD